LNHFSLKLVVILIITFNGLFLASLITIGQLIADRRSLKTWLFFLLFLIFCLYQVHYIFFEVGNLEKYKIINLFPITAVYLLGPAILGITMHAVKEKYMLTKGAFFHFIPALFASFTSLVIIFNTEYQQFNVLYGYYYNRLYRYANHQHPAEKIRVR
jgi:hypothetical protein